MLPNNSVNINRTKALESKISNATQLFYFLKKYEDMIGLCRVFPERSLSLLRYSSDRNALVELKLETGTVYIHKVPQNLELELWKLLTVEEVYSMPELSSHFSKRYRNVAAFRTANGCLFDCRRIKVLGEFLKQNPSITASGLLLLHDDLMGNTLQWIEKAMINYNEESEAFYLVQRDSNDLGAFKDLDFPVFAIHGLSFLVKKFMDCQLTVTGINPVRDFGYMFYLKGEIERTRNELNGSEGVFWR